MKKLLRSSSLQNRLSISPHSSLSTLEQSLKGIFYLLFALKFTAHVWFYLLICPETTVSMRSTTTVATTFRFSLPRLYFPFTGQNLEFEKLKPFSIPRSLASSVCDNLPRTSFLLNLQPFWCHQLITPASSPPARLLLGLTLPSFKIHFLS